MSHISPLDHRRSAQHTRAHNGVKIFCVPWLARPARPPPLEDDIWELEGLAVTWAAAAAIVARFCSCIALIPEMGKQDSLNLIFHYSTSQASQISLKKKNTRQSLTHSLSFTHLPNCRPSSILYTFILAWKLYDEVVAMLQKRILVRGKTLSRVPSLRSTLATTTSKTNKSDSAGRLVFNWHYGAHWFKRLYKSGFTFCLNPCDSPPSCCMPPN